MKSRPTVVAAVLALLITGCGSSEDSRSEAVEDSQDRAAEVKPCELITKAEAEAAYGGSLAEGEARNEVVSTCVFATTSDDIKRFADNVQVQVQPVYVFDGTKQVTSQGTTLESAFTIEPVSGIGDDAFYQITTAAGSNAAASTLLGFKKKDVSIYISVSNRDFDLARVKTAEKQLAEKAASRL